MNTYPAAHQPELEAIWRRSPRQGAPLPRAELETWKAGEPFEKLVATFASRSPASAALRYMQWAKGANMPELYERAKTLYSDIMNASGAENSALRQWRNRSELARLQTERMRYEWMNDPDTVRGQKVQAGASKSGLERASKTGLKGRATEMQAAIDELHRKRPRLSYTDLKRKVAERFGCSTKTVDRYTSNPRR